MNIEVEGFISDTIKQVRGKFGIEICVGGKTVYSLNANEQFPAASTIKVLILGAVINDAYNRNISLDEKIRVTGEPVGGCGILEFLHNGIEVTIRDLLHFMICISDNKAANILIDILGIERINDFISRIGFTRTVLRRKMMDFTAQKKGLENLTSPHDMAQVFLSIDSNNFVNEEISKTMKEILSRQQFTDILKLFLPEEVPSISKSGVLPGSVLETGILYKNGKAITLSLMVTGIRNNGEGKVILGKVAQFVYENF
ncbi:MAG: serine hydrolase [Caldisericum sp.]|jgi:beta-lactamase class A|nr:serine hydrolase [Caldisericum sp.]